MMKLLNDYGVVAPNPETKAADAVIRLAMADVRPLLDSLDLQDVFVMRQYLVQALDLELAAYMVWRQMNKRKEENEAKNG